MLVKLNMDILLLILVSLAISAFLKAFFSLFFDSKTIIHNQLPPGPPTLPLIGNVFWLYTPISKFESHIRSLHAKFGPIITIHFVSRPFIMVADRFIAYKALIQNGAAFADRPGAIAAARVLDKSQNSISSSSYGPTLRLLRGNLATGIFHPSRVKSHAHARKRVLQTLQNRLVLLSESGEPIQVLEHLQLAMYSLLANLCFGDKLSQKQMEEIEEVEHRATLHLSNISIFHFWKSFSKIVLRKRRAWSLKIRKDQEDVFIPLIRARKKLKEERSTKSNMEDQDYVLSYVDTLLELRFPANHDKIQLTERDILSFCNEFLNAGAGTTTTALEWILANLVKYPEIQEKLFMEIKGVVRDGDRGVKEDDLQEMPYLKAIILEGLRRHPPTHVSLPHAVTEDTTLNEYLVPKQGTVVFMLADIGWDPNSWEDPMAFKPERFLSSSGGDSFDITGSREIKMMPFGVGRRMCPGYGLAMLILEYFVANLIWSFEWKAVDGDGVDLSEKQEFTMVMKNPLQVQISPRWKNN